MEKAMHARLMAIAAAALTFGTAAFADPPKARDAQPAQQASPPAQVVFASADQSEEPTPPTQQTAPPVKRPRVARVTTCRCGDQQASDQQ
jgi:hypothetical protein